MREGAGGRGWGRRRTGLARGPLSILWLCTASGIFDIGCIVVTIVRPQPPLAQKALALGRGFHSHKIFWEVAEAIVEGRGGILRALLVQ